MCARIASMQYCIFSENGYNMPAKQSIGTGSCYHITRTMMAKYLELKTLNIPSLHPVQYSKTRDMGFKTLPAVPYYRLLIGTDNPQAILDAIAGVAIRNNLSPDTYMVESNPTKLRDKEKVAKYPYMVTLSFSVGYFPFSYRALVKDVPGNHFLSTLYNNGIVPVCPFKFEIPECLKLVRKARHSKIAREGSKLSDYILCDVEIAQQAIKLGLTLNVIISGSDYSANETFESAYRSDARIELRDDVSVLLPAKHLNPLVRECNSNLISQAEVEVLDCLPVKYSMNYRRMCGHKISSACNESNQLKYWLEFVGRRTSPFCLSNEYNNGATIRGFSNKYSNLLYTQIDSNFLVMILKLTLKADNP